MTITADDVDLVAPASVRDPHATFDALRQSGPVHFLPRHVHFPHQVHVAAMGPNACATCHGDVSRMPQVFKVNNVNNMGWCISCHVERQVTRDCTACHY